MRILILDNYDSFTFNLYQLLGEVTGLPPEVRPNDGIGWPKVRDGGFDAIVISPGPGRPGRPADFGICATVIRRSQVPLLGVCLGHQGIAEAYGGSVCPAREVMHGRISPIRHDGDPLFTGIPQGADVVRYHSLVVARPLPPALREIAWTEDGVLMGLRHRSRPQWGVQFHPESICSTGGRRLLANFVGLAEALAPSGRVKARGVDG